MADEALRNIAMMGLRDAVGKNDPYTIAVVRDHWIEREIITDADAAEITGLLAGGKSSAAKQTILNMIGAYGSFEAARQTVDAFSKGLLTSADTREIYSAMYQAANRQTGRASLPHGKDGAAREPAKETAARR